MCAFAVKRKRNLDAKISHYLSLTKNRQLHPMFKKLIVKIVIMSVCVSTVSFPRNRKSTHYSGETIKKDETSYSIISNVTRQLLAR